MINILMPEDVLKLIAVFTFMDVFTFPRGTVKSIKKQAVISRGIFCRNDRAIYVFERGGTGITPIP